MLNFQSEHQASLIASKCWSGADKNTPRPGIEPGSPAWQAGILATILSRITITFKNNSLQTVSICYGGLAQMVERSPCTREAGGSMPPSSIPFFYRENLDEEGIKFKLSACAWNCLLASRKCKACFFITPQWSAKTSIFSLGSGVSTGEWEAEVCFFSQSAVECQLATGKPKFFFFFFPLGSGVLKHVFHREKIHCSW